MSHRTTPSSAEMLRVMRHLADVAAMKHDPAAQRQLLVNGLSAIFDTTVGWMIVVDDCRLGRELKPVHGVLVSNPDPVWDRYCADFAVHVAPRDDFYADNIMRCDDAEQQWQLRQVLPNLAAHRRYARCVQMVEQSGIGEGAVIGYHDGPGGDRFVCFSLHRCRGDPLLRPRDYALHRFALREVRDLAARGHLPMDTPPPTLPPRLRQVLGALLAGQTPKQIARALDLSVWTVREHIQRLYARFGVSGREELMARFVGAKRREKA